MTAIQQHTIRQFGVNSSEEMEPLMMGIGLSAAPALVLPDTATCGETQRLLLEQPQAACIVVCDRKQRPVGLVMSDAFYIQMNAEYEPEHLYELPISRLMNLHPLKVDFATPPGIVRERAESRPSRTRKDAIVVTREGEFFGVVLPENL
ncbi:hypothetical protein [Saccharibacillus sacchari]|uniref:hypothetical protein n=1 Tax=Saccharibacillus sacchari TaxID=456493 RepID=UPI0004B2EEA0|nr:hypothetical protein [Saccharibacillus sacchari]